jgi:hypothetical protein
VTLVVESRGEKAESSELGQLRTSVIEEELVQELCIPRSIVT